MQNKCLNKIEALQKFAVNPVEILEDQFDPQTEDYIERRKLLKATKGQIQQNSKDIEIVFHSVGDLNNYKADITFSHKTAFNTQCIVNLSGLYGEIAAVLKRIEKADKKLRNMPAYNDVYSVFSQEVECNMFELFTQDLSSILELAKVRNENFNNTAEKQYLQELDLDTQVYINSFKDGFKARDSKYKDEDKKK